MAVRPREAAASRIGGSEAFGPDNVQQCLPWSALCGALDGSQERHPLPFQTSARRWQPGITLEMAYVRGLPRRTKCCTPLMQVVPLRVQQLLCVRLTGTYLYQEDSGRPHAWSCSSEGGMSLD